MMTKIKAAIRYGLWTTDLYFKGIDSLKEKWARCIEVSRDSLKNNSSNARSPTVEATDPAAG